MEIIFDPPMVPQNRTIIVTTCISVNLAQHIGLFMSWRNIKVAMGFYIRYVSQFMTINVDSIDRVQMKKRVLGSFLLRVWFPALLDR